MQFMDMELHYRLARQLRFLATPLFISLLTVAVLGKSALPLVGAWMLMLIIAASITSLRRDHIRSLFTALRARCQGLIKKRNSP